jgi:hypothetical protein
MYPYKEKAEKIECAALHSHFPFEDELEEKKR